MKNLNFKFLFVLFLLLNVPEFFSQAELTNGPELKNDRDCRMNRLIKGDGDSFYAYRIRSRGKGTSFVVEKYSKALLSPVFSKEVNLEDESTTRVIDVEYAGGNIFVFRSQHDKKTDKMSLFYQTISSTGVGSETLKEVTSINTAKAKFVSFSVYMNPATTRFLIKASYKMDKDAPYQTDFILMDALNQKKLWTKTVNRKLFSNMEGQSLNLVSTSMFGNPFGMTIDFEDIGFIGLHLDNEDNVYYAYTAEANDWTGGEKKYRLSLGILNAEEKNEKTFELEFEDKYFVSDVEFLKTKKDEIVVGGFLKNIEQKKGRDQAKVGVFQFSIDLKSNSVKSKSKRLFEDEILEALETDREGARDLKYKLDYIITQENAVYFVGEQYKEEMKVMQRTTTGRYGGGSTNTDIDWKYEYMDVIVAKLNANGQFEWIRNLPLRQKLTLHNKPHVFKQYIVYGNYNYLYMLCDDHPKNMERYASETYEPEDLKSVSGIHGSNFICNQLNLRTGEIKRKLLMKNEDYCFAPIQEKNPSFIPPSDTEIFVPSENQEIFIYTEDAGRDRFAKIKFD